MGAGPVRHRQDRRHPRQRQPGLRRPRVGVRPATGRHHPPGLRGPAQGQRLPRDDRAGARREPGAARGGLPRRPHLGRTAGRRRHRPAHPARRVRHDADRRRPGQHPVHLGHHRLPQGRHPLPPQHPQQRLLGRRDRRLHRAGPGVSAGALLPLLRHGHGQPRRHLARGLHRHPGPRLRRRHDSPGRPGRALHLPLRRAHHVHRRAQPPRLRLLRPLLPPHRHHGGLAVPRGGDEAGGRRDEHGRGLHLLRHDRDLPGLHPDPPRTTTSNTAPRPSAGCCRTSR